MTNTNIDKLLDNCQLLQNRTIYAEGCMHSSTRCFDACMRAFDAKVPAQSITFKIYFNAPILAESEATFYRAGRMEMKLTPPTL